MSLYPFPLAHLQPPSENSGSVPTGRLLWLSGSSFWQDVSRTVPAGVGDPVGAWYDADAGIAVSQENAALRPVRQSDGIALDGGNDYLQTEIGLPGSLTVSAWFRRASEPDGAPVIVGKISSWGFDVDFSLMGWFSGGLHFRISAADLSENTTINWPAVSYDEWHLAVAWYDAVTGEVGLSVDNETPLTVAGPATRRATATPVSVGGAPVGYFPGRLTNIGLWSRVLTAEERTALFSLTP